MKIIYLFCSLTLLTFGCSTNTEKETKTTETIKVVEVEAPAKTKVVEEEKGTTITVGSNGGSLKSKDVDITVKD